MHQGFVMICTLPELSPERSLNGAPMTEMPVVDDAEYPNWSPAAVSAPVRI